MKNRFWIVLSALAAVALSAPSAEAQRRGGLERGQQMNARSLRGGPGVEGILRQRANLELSESQIESLNRLRLETLGQRSTFMEQAARIRSDIGAGELDREDARDALHELRDEQHEASDRLREAIDGILTEEQQEKLSEQRVRRGGRDGIGRRGGRGMNRGDAQRQGGPRMRRGPGAA